MKKELELKLCKNYPSFFREYGGDPAKTCMSRGLEVGEGWYPLIDDLCYKIKKECEKDKSCDFYFTQIKEKFGLLRINHQGGNSLIKNAIRSAEEESSKVCYHCGSMNEVTTSGSYILTLCEECRSQKQQWW